MGIPTYFAVIVRAYPNILIKRCPQGCTDFFMDFNGVVHQAVYYLMREAEATGQAIAERDILEQTWRQTQACVAKVRPSKNVGIFLDGVAPVAKMLQQRKRRYLSVFQAKLDGVATAAGTWDRNAISPGTPFMARLNAFLGARIRERPDTHIGYQFSSSDEVGEGEHKIFRQIHGLAPKSRVIVHGLDADLIMLALLSHHPDIHLMREDADAEADVGDGFAYLSVHNLRMGLLREVKQKYKWPVTDAVFDDPYGAEAVAVIERYVMSCFLLGNDFLPHMPCLHLKRNGHETLLEIVGNVLRSMDAPDTNTFFAEVLKQLAETEDKELWFQNEKYMKVVPRGDIKLPSDLYAIRRENKHPLAAVIYGLANGGKWRPHYYKHLFHCQMHDSSVVLSACRTYLQGLHWTLAYYKRLPKDPEWFYPYGYAPSLLDLANFTEGLTPDEAAQLLAAFTVPANEGFVDPHVQLLCIMPKHSADILPPEVRRVMHDRNGVAAHMFPTSFPIQTYLKTHLWECVPVLPMLDLTVIRASLQA